MSSVELKHTREIGELRERIRGLENKISSIKHAVLQYSESSDKRKTDGS